MNRRDVLSLLAGACAADGLAAPAMVDHGAPLDAVAYPVTGTQIWRLTFDVPVAPGAVVNMRAYLRKERNALTETWFHQAFGA